MRGRKNIVGNREPGAGKNRKSGTRKNRVGKGEGLRREAGRAVSGGGKSRVGMRKKGGAGTLALSHVDARGHVRMVDVGDKAVTSREAVARAHVSMSAAARRLIRSGAVAKGDPLQAARLAGIMAAKRTSELIPLCHPLVLTHVSVDIKATRTGYLITATVRTAGQTGVEMEALTAVAIAALTVYDMLKAVDKGMVIGEVCLVEKRGGRSGHYRRL